MNSEQGIYNTSNKSLYFSELKHLLLLQFLAQFHIYSTMQRSGVPQRARIIEKRCELQYKRALVAQSKLLTGAMRQPSGHEMAKSHFLTASFLTTN